MSFDSILARSPSIIFQPGGAPGQDLVATTWAEVQAFIALRDGAVIVYVDDSLAPCTVPGASGVTDCQGRVEIRPYRPDQQNFSTLTIEAGATLKSIYKLSGTVFLECNPTTATPSLDFDYSANVVGTPWPILFLADSAALGTATTATTPACVVPANEQLYVFMDDFSMIAALSASAVFQLAAASTTLLFIARNSVFEGLTGAIPSTWVQGAGRFLLSFDAGTAGYTNNNAGGPVLAPGVAFTNAATNITIPVDGNTVAYPTAFTPTQTIYVTANGSDTSGNGSQSFPFLTIQKALDGITDATTSKRYVVDVGPGEYPAAFNVKPWVAIQGHPNSSGFDGVTEITAAAGSIGFDGSFATSGFSVFWMSHLVLANALTLNYSASANQEIQGTFFDVDFNGGFSFIGAGTGGVDNWTLDNCLVYDGGTAQGVQFLFTVGGTQFLGGTVTIQAAPSASATESTTWLAQNTAVGSAFSPTNVHVLWAAPTPAVFLSALDWNNTNCVGQVNLDGASSSAKIAGLRPADVIQSNSASPAVVQPLYVEMIFTASANNVLSALQSAGTIPSTGTIPITMEGFGGTGGGGGGTGGTNAAPGGGAGGSGGAMYQTGTFDCNLADPLNIVIGAGGTPGAGGAAGGGLGTTGGDGGATEAIDGTTTVVLASFVGSSGGSFIGRGGANYAGGVVVPRITDAFAPYGNGFPAGGGEGGLAGSNGTNGQGTYQNFNVTVPPARWTGGAGGATTPAEGGGGGGGGAGPFASGGAGGAGQPAGTPGGNGVGVAANTGAGVGGGAGGTSNTDAGGSGATGSTGWCKIRLPVQ